MRRPALPAFTLVEALVLLSIFSIITVTFYSVYSNSAWFAIDTRHRLSAVAVANQEMEKLRNLSYEDVGFDDEASLPLRGILPSSDREKTIMRSNGTFTVKTIIQNIDDPEDGLAGGSPNDAVPNDSKRVRIDVSWGASESQTVRLVSRFVPDGIEMISGGGNVVVNVNDSSGEAVSTVLVRITHLVNGTTTECVTENGSCLFIGLEEATDRHYKVSLSKSGYESVETRSVTASLDPVDKHLTILAGFLQTVSFAMDKTYSIRIRPKEIFGSDTLDTVRYTLFGGRLLGTDPSNANKNVYAVPEAEHTGSFSIASATPGTYFVNRDSLTPSTNEYWKIDRAEGTDPFSFVLDVSGTPNEFTILAIDRARTGVFFTVTSSGSPVPEASVRVFDPIDPTQYDTTILTDQFGRAYFPHEASSTMLPQAYQYEVKGVGYQDGSGTATLVLNEMKSEEVSLNPL